jgi:hypothetical protein
MEKLPVLFRANAYGVTAVFPTLPENPGEFRCYSHIGQHSACTRAWYRTTKPAAPTDYAPLLAELAAIYDDCVLIPVKRWRRAA